VHIPEYVPRVPRRRVFLVQAAGGYPALEVCVFVCLLPLQARDSPRRPQDHWGGASLTAGCWPSPVFTPSPHSRCLLIELGLTTLSPSLDSRCYSWDDLQPPKSASLCDAGFATLVRWRWNAASPCSLPVCGFVRILI